MKASKSWKIFFSLAALFTFFLPSFLSAQGLFNNAYCAGVSAPDIVPAGKAFTAGITMVNTGTKEWQPTVPHRLISRSGSAWGVTEIDLPFNVPPHLSVGFRALFRAPLGPGDYPFNWRMAEGSGKFFGETCIFTISVGESEVTGSVPQTPSEPLTEPGAPVATTRPATLITDKTALLNGAMHPRLVPTAAWFEWGDTPSLGRKTLEQQIGSGTDARNYSFLVTDLLPDTRYFFRAVGQNRHGIGIDAIVELRTLVQAPVVSPPPSPLPLPLPPPPAPALPEKKPPSVSIPPERKKTTDSSGDIIVTLSADKSNPAPGDEVNLVIGYENNRARALTDARLRLVLPPSGARFVTASLLPSGQGREEVSFRLGEVRPGATESIVARVLVDRAAERGAALVFRAVLEYEDSAGLARSDETFLALTIAESRSSLVPVTAAFIAGLLILLVGFFIFLFIRMRKKRET